MALIGEIRKNKWLLVGSMTAALFLFIAMLMFDNPNQSLFGDSPTLLANIEGEKVDYQEFSRTHDMLYSQQQSSTDGYNERTSLWNYYLDNAIISKEAEALGLGVSKAELIELQFSQDNARLSPIISSRYANPSTGQLDRQQIDQLKEIITTGKIDEMIAKQQLVPDFKHRWAHQEKEIIKDRLQSKLSNMVAKAMYTPAWMAEAMAADQSQRMDILYVQVPFDEIESSEVKLADADYEAWFKENKHTFKQDEETRKVEYVVFPVKPTLEDSSALRQRVADLVPGFQTTTSDSVFVESNQGAIDAAFVKKSELSPAIADTIGSLAVGSVYGPYLDGAAYKAVKLTGKKVIADSVKARHILRAADSQETYAAATKTIDSLLNLLNTGAASFDSLALKFSTDQSNAGKGGDLGFFAPGRMVKEFNDLAFFKAEPGKPYKVVTEFGIHILEVTDRKFGSSSEPWYQVAYLSEAIVPSQATQDAVREQALQLQESSPDLETLRKNAAAKNMETETSPALKPNDYAIGSLGANNAAREMVRWAFGVGQNAKPAKVGGVSPQVYSFQDQGQFFTSKYAVAGLKSILPAGTPSLADVRGDIEQQVVNRKKGEIIAGRLKGKTDLASIAAEFSAKVDTAASVTFSSAYIGDKGSEPKVVAQAFKVEVNQVSEPLVGNSGVFVVMPTSKPAPTPAANLAQIQQQSAMGTRSLVKGRLMPTLRKGADVKDNRAKFF